VCLHHALACAALTTTGTLHGASLALHLFHLGIGSLHALEVLLLEHRHAGRHCGGAAGGGWWVVLRRPTCVVTLLVRTCSGPCTISGTILPFHCFTACCMHIVIMWCDCVQV
jgi:hypothetical protein